MLKQICSAAVVCFLYLIGISEVSARDCLLHVTNHPKEKFFPVFLFNHSSHSEIAVPRRGVVKLARGENITLLCPDARNYLTATHSNSTFATCLGGSTLRVIRENMQLDDIQCKKIVHGDVLETQDPCGNSMGHLIHIGYRIKRNDWISLIKVCYDARKGGTVYTEHRINGEELKYASKSTYRPSFSTAGLSSDVAASVAYKKPFQKATFNSLLGSALLADYYINENSYLARGHLSPDADFLFATSQFATYYYINTCPQWQTINTANWKSIEITVRKTAERYNRTFTVVTGTYGVLKLTNSRNTETAIHLVSKKKLPVPEYLWKIVYDEHAKSGIALVVVNNPFLKNVGQKDLLCTNICYDYGWGTNAWSDLRHGYVFCCDLTEFVSKVNTAPRFHVRKILHGISEPYVD